MVGIYAIVNLINDRVYVGQAVDILHRFNEHKWMLNSNIHTNSHLQSAWNKYGSDNFEFMVLEECDISTLTERENHWINYFGGVNCDKTYNFIAAKDSGGHNDISKAKISASLKQYYSTHEHHSKGKILSDEIRQHISDGHKGHKHSTETRLKIGNSQKGKIISKEQREMISNYARGRTLGDETKKKISGSLKGRNLSKEAKRKLRQKAIGRPVDKYARVKISIANTKFKIEQIDIETQNVIQVFESAISASNWLIENGYSKAKLSNCRSMIYNVCNGKLNSAYGFSWRYKDVHDLYVSSNN